MSQIFLVAVIEQPTKKAREEENAMPKLILEPTAVIARDDKDAALKIAMNGIKITQKDCLNKSHPSSA